MPRVAPARTRSGLDDRLARSTRGPKGTSADCALNVMKRVGVFGVKVADFFEQLWCCWRNSAYLTRFHTISTLPPPDPVGLVHFISSPVRVISRFCSVPSQLGNVLPSIRKVTAPSASCEFSTVITHHLQRCVTTAVKHEDTFRIGANRAELAAIGARGLLRDERPSSDDLLF